jgi:hypothetical protein
MGKEGSGLDKEGKERKQGSQGDEVESRAAFRAKSVN